MGMKSGTCPKCRRRNVSRWNSERERRHLTLTQQAHLESAKDELAQVIRAGEVRCVECFGSGGKYGKGEKLEVCDECGGSGWVMLTSRLVADLEQQVERIRNPIHTTVFACSDCHYSETYLSDAQFPGQLDTYPGWERVSAPPAGPFR